MDIDTCLWKTRLFMILHIPLFLRECCPEDPDSEESVVIVVTLLLALLLDLKLNPLLALLYECVLLFLPSTRWPLLLMFLCAVLWLDSLRVRLSDKEEVVVVFDLPILSLLFLKISDSLCVTVGCLVAVVWCRLKSSMLNHLTVREVTFYLIFTFHFSAT